MRAASANNTTGTGRKFRIRIVWKITAVVLLVLLVLAVVNILVVRGRFRVALNREFESKALAIATSVARAAEGDVGGDMGTVQSVMDHFRDIHGVRYIFVQDARGKLVAATFKGDFPEGIAVRDLPEGGEPYTFTRFRQEGLGDVLELAMPVLSGQAGAVRVGMDRTLIGQDLGRLTGTLIGQFALAQVIGILVLYPVIAFLLRHVKRILEALQKLGRGDLTVRLHVRSRDEFEDLVGHLNTTVDHLASMIARVEQSCDGLVRARSLISRVYSDVLEGTEQQAGLAAETMQSVASSKKMIDEITEGIHVLETSANDSFSSVMEMGASIEEVSSMSDALFKAVEESNSAVESLSTSIDDIGRNLLALSRSSDETASAMSEMSASIAEVRGNAESTSRDAVRMTEVAEGGAGESRNAVEGMRAIKESSGQVIELITLLSSRIEEIDEILRFITDITGKTNLLALNAAIIAAQAGAHGKGFGVVADEINELAQSTRAQTNRIAQVIEGIREEVRRTSRAVEESARSIDEGVSLVDRVTGALEAILENILLVSHKVAEIARTTSEQADTSSRVLKNTEGLTASADNIRTASEHQGQTGERLLTMSRGIHQAAEKVKTSTEEQTLTSQQINRDLTRISETVRGISESTEIQAVNGSRVLKMMGDLSGVIEKNREAVRSLKGVIGDLGEGMEALAGELASFVTTSKNHPDEESSPREPEA